MTTQATATASVVEETLSTQAPTAPLKLNSGALNKLAELFGETDIRRMARVEVEKLLTQRHEMVLASATKNYEQIGVLVAILAEYIRKFKPTYKEIAAIIQTSDLKHTLPAKRRIFQGRKNLAPVLEKEGPSAYRQYATRYVKMAKWTLGEFTKGESPVDSITINSVEYLTPVDALIAGYSMNAVMNAWKWGVLPKSKGVDLAKLPTRPTVTASQEAAASITVPIRALNEGKTEERRKAVPVISNSDALFGTVLGLLEGAEALGETEFSHEDSAKLIALITKMTVAAPVAPATA